MKEKKSSKENCCRKKLHIILGILAVLILLRAGYLFLPIGYEIVGNAATATSACPTRDTLREHSHYETGPERTAAAAIATANGLLNSRADTEGGLAALKYSCPNPACQKKTNGNVTATADPGYAKASSITLFAIFAKAFDFFRFDYFSGQMEYNWQVRVTCS